MVTTSDVTIDMDAITQNGTKRRISGEGRKEKERIHTLLGDMKEEERDEETGWEEEAMTRQHDQHDEIHEGDADELNGLKYNPNERERDPPDLKDMEMGNQVCRSQEPKFDDDGGACRLEHATSSIVKPKGPRVTVEFLLV